MARALLEDVSVHRYKFVAWMALVGHPVYWCIWSFYYPEYLDSAFFRFGSALIFLLLLLKAHWPRWLQPYTNNIWHFALMLALPSTFTYTLLANNYNSLWLATHVGMLLLLQTAVQHTRIFFLLLVPGTIIGILWYKLTIGGDAFAHFPKEYVPLFVFVTIVGLSFLHLSTQNIIETERCLENEKQKVEQERQKSSNIKSLAGTIAHEMRNPLSQINGTIHYLWQKKPPENPESEMYLQDLKQVINSSFQLIDITMDAINEKPINKDKFELMSALDVCSGAVSDYAYKESSLRTRISVVGGDFRLFADPVLVKYILYNLIGNALYYVQKIPDAEIVISTFPAFRQIEVRDTGPGISKENLPKLFDSFFTSGKEGGTGLGLAYCMRTMQALGGDIYCDSKLGEYTAFKLSFPEVDVKKTA